MIVNLKEFIIDYMNSDRYGNEKYHTLKEITNRLNQECKIGDKYITVSTKRNGNEVADFMKVTRRKYKWIGYISG